MLRMVLGPDWVALRAYLLEKITEETRQGQGGRIWIVPELISHDTERRLCRTAGDSVSRYAEVLSFTRLARRVDEEMGGGRESLDAGGRIVAMAAAARQLHSRLKAYAALETRPEFLAAMVEAVDEFKRCCVSAEDLQAAAGETQGALAQKLEELALLLHTYDAICAQGKRDSRDQMTCLLEQLAAGDFGKRHRFYIDCFPDFSRQHLEILQELIRTSPCVTVAMNTDEPYSAAPAFEKAGETAGLLLRYAREAGVPVEILRIPAGETALGPVCQGLFQGPCAPCEGVKALRADSVYQEVLLAAERICELVRSGERYRDISLVCCDFPRYRGTLEQVFRRFGIPLYLAGTEELLGKTVISALISAMEAALGGFEQPEVLRYLRSLLSPLTVEECDLVENDAIVRSVRGSRWLTPWADSPEDGEERQRLEELRKKALDPLARLSDRFRQAQNLAQEVEGLYAFLEEVGLAQRLTDMAGELERSGDNRSAQILNQVWEILVTAMEQLHDVLGQTVWEPALFTRLFALLLGQYHVGTIPPVLDAVTAGAVSAQRCQVVKHLFVLGAVEGALPAYGTSSGVLTDQERGQLRAMGLPLNGSAGEKLKNEYAEIYGAFCGARETVTVSYPGGQHSYLFRRLAEMAGGEEQPVPGLGAAEADPLEAGILLWGRGAQTLADGLGLHGAYLLGSRWASYSLGRVSPRHIQALYGNELQLSASRVDTQANCRLAYFLKYGLGLRECRAAEEDPTEFGNYIHKVLEWTAQAVMERGGFAQVSLEETLALAAQATERYRREMTDQEQSQRAQYLFQRNRQELDMVVQELWSELSSISFQPSELELAFGGDAALPAIPVADRVSLQGYIDRVDTWEQDGRRYYRVVDYKSGKKDLDYCDIYNGLGLQMLLYLFALRREGAAIPAGVQYFPARAPVITQTSRPSPEKLEQERVKLWKRSGLLLKDGQVLQAMAPEGDLRRLCCTEKKGELVGDLADPAQMRLLEKHVFQAVAAMAADIRSGDVTPNPYTRGSSHDACRYCPYASVCRSGSDSGRRNYKAMSSAEFWEELGKEEEDRG